jgi:DNA invertase Pin-like site-specific DNA recombinase
MVPAKQGVPKLVPDEVIEIVRRCNAGETFSAVARRYGVSRATVAHILHGRVWTDITGIERC